MFPYPAVRLKSPTDRGVKCSAIVLSSSLYPTFPHLFGETMFRRTLYAEGVNYVARIPHILVKSRQFLVEENDGNTGVSPGIRQFKIGLAAIRGAVR